jgi:hypothetical protein
VAEAGKQAPGHPGFPPTWTIAAKRGVGTVLSPASRVWFTLSQGILNEVYYPRVDCGRPLEHRRLPHRPGHTDTGYWLGGLPR